MATASKSKSKRTSVKSKQAKLDVRRAKVAELLLQSKTYREIARAVKVASTRTIHDDVTAVIAEWKTQQQHHVSEWIALELERIGRIESSAWIAWEHSRENAETETVEHGKDGTRTIHTTKGQSGNPTFLDVILKCVTRRCELLGLDEPTEVNVPGLLSPDEIEKRRQARWQKVMPALQTALALKLSPRNDNAPVGESVSNA